MSVINFKDKYILGVFIRYLKRKRAVTGLFKFKAHIFKCKVNVIKEQARLAVIGRKTLSKLIYVNIHCNCNLRIK